MNAIIAVILATMFVLAWVDKSNSFWRYLAIIALAAIAGALRLFETGYL
jgi:Flp pilus assembly protein protease CpaA